MIEFLDPDDTSLTERKPVRYLTHLGLNSHIFTNSNAKEEIDGGRYTTESVFLHGNELITGTMTIESRYKLRPIDDEVFMAILSIFEERGNFDVELPPVGAKNYDEELKKNIAKARRVDGIHLNEICSHIGNLMTTKNRVTLIESLHILGSLKMMVTSRSGENSENLNKSGIFGLINEAEFSKTDSNMAGYVTQSDKCVQDILEGKTSMIQLSMFLKLPRGRPRAFFKFIHSVLRDSPRHVVELDHLFHNIIGYSNNESQSRKNRHHFKEQAKIFEDWQILLPGFSLPSHQREYSLIFSGKENVEFVDLRQGPYFENPEKHPIPRMNTIERQNIVRDLSEIGGLNEKYIMLYVGAITGQECNPIIEKNNGEGNFPIKKRLSVDPNGGILVEYPDQNIKPKKISLSWKYLSTLLDYIKLFKKHSPHRHKYTGAVILRKSIEEGEFYNLEQHREFQEAEKKEIEEQKRIKEALDQAEIQKIKKEKEEIERKNMEEQEILIRKEFEKCSMPFRMGSEAEAMVSKAILERVVINKRQYTWFANVRYYSINKDLIIVVQHLLARDWIRSRYNPRLCQVLREMGYDEVHVIVDKEYLEMFKDAFPKVSPPEIPNLEAISVTKVEEGRVSVEPSKPSQKLKETPNKDFCQDAIIIFEDIIKMNHSEAYKFLRIVGTDHLEIDEQLDSCLDRKSIFDKQVLKIIINDNIDAFRNAFYAKCGLD